MQLVSTVGASPSHETAMSSKHKHNQTRPWPFLMAGTVQYQHFFLAVGQMVNMLQYAKVYRKFNDITGWPGDILQLSKFLYKSRPANHCPFWPGSRITLFLNISKQVNQIKHFCSKFLTISYFIKHFVVLYSVIIKYFQNWMLTGLKSRSISNEWLLLFIFIRHSSEMHSQTKILCRKKKMHQ